MKVGVLVSGFSFVIGLFLGLYSGYYPKFGAVVMRFCDAVKAIPSLMLAIALVGVMGAGEKNVILTLIIVSIPDITRVARSITLQVEQQTYIEALQASGASNLRHHLAQYRAGTSSCDGAGARISFISRDRRHLGGVAELLSPVGIPMPEPSWGNVANAEKRSFFRSWWMIRLPGALPRPPVLGAEHAGRRSAGLPWTALTA
ncbi:MAG: ABC transporter permease [Acutalibacteraceae bacterium]